MAHTSDDNAAQAWFERGLAEGRRQASYEAGLVAGRSTPQPDASSLVRAPHGATMAALAQASIPAGHPGSTGMTTASASTPAPMAAAAGEVIDWDAIVAQQNAKTEAEAARAGRRVSYGRSL